MKTLHIATGKPYDIIIERGIIDQCGTYVRGYQRQKRQ